VLCMLAGCNSKLAAGQWQFALLQTTNAQRSARHPQGCCRKMVQAKRAVQGQALRMATAICNGSGDGTRHSNWSCRALWKTQPKPCPARRLAPRAGEARAGEAGTVPAASTAARTLSGRPPRVWLRLGERVTLPRIPLRPAGASLRRHDWRCRGPTPAGSIHRACRK
jgi:hypothetical protein